MAVQIKKLKMRQLVCTGITEITDLKRMRNFQFVFWIREFNL